MASFKEAVVLLLPLFFGISLPHECPAHQGYQGTPHQVYRGGAQQGYQGGAHQGNHGGQTATVPLRRTGIQERILPGRTDQMQYVYLPNNAGKIPMVGYGTFQAQDEELEKALDLALQAGYRHIDTATLYENEHVIGKVLDKWMKSGRVKREELFVVSKLPPTGNRPKDVEPYLKQSLKNLKLDYLDLYLIHSPFAFKESGGELEKKADHIGVWKEMEKQVYAKRAKAIGLSNFNSTQILKILETARIPPANLQVELHTYLQQNNLYQFCKDHGISMTAYSPIGGQAADPNQPRLLDDPTVSKLAKKYQKTPAQIILRHTTQRGIIVIPKSTNANRLKQNIELFDFELSDQDVRELNALDKGPYGRTLDYTFLPGAKDTDDYPFFTA